MKKLFQAIPSLAVMLLLVWGPTFFMSGCGDSAPSTATGPVQPMPTEEKDSIKKAMEANQQKQGR